VIPQPTQVVRPDARSFPSILVSLASSCQNQQLYLCLVAYVFCSLVHHWSLKDCILHCTNRSLDTTSCQRCLSSLPSPIIPLLTLSCIAQAQVLQYCNCPCLDKDSLVYYTISFLFFRPTFFLIAAPLYKPPPPARRSSYPRFRIKGSRARGPSL
jgi:hypothetical protein